MYYYYFYDEKKQAYLMQLSTEPFIADTWVVTRSYFSERLAGACVHCSLQVLVLLQC